MLEIIICRQQQLVEWDGVLHKHCNTDGFSEHWPKHINQSLMDTFIYQMNIYGVPDTALLNTGYICNNEQGKVYALLLLISSELSNSKTSKQTR